jgi:hypothetical protein
MSNLSKFSAVNKLFSPYLEFLENRKRLTKLKDSFDEEVYEEINNLLDNLKFDHTSFVSQLRQTVITGTISTVLTQEVNKSDSSTEESDNEEVEKEVEKPKSPVKAFTKRLQFNKKKEDVEENNNKKDVKEVVKKSKRLPGL